MGQETIKVTEWGYIGGVVTIVFISQFLDVILDYYFVKKTSVRRRHVVALFPG